MHELYCDMCGKNKVLDSVSTGEDTGVMGKSYLNCMVIDGKALADISAKEGNLVKRVFSYLVYHFDLCAACQYFIREDLNCLLGTEEEEKKETTSE